MMSAVVFGGRNRAGSPAEGTKYGTRLRKNLREWVSLSGRYRNQTKRPEKFRERRGTEGIPPLPLPKETRKKTPSPQCTHPYGWRCTLWRWALRVGAKGCCAEAENARLGYEKSETGHLFGDTFCLSLTYPQTMKRHGDRSQYPTGVERLRVNVSRIIPGDWGKAGSGWLAQPLGAAPKGNGSGGRIHQFLWRRSRAVSNAIQELGGQERLETAPNRVK
jgi:hypothetical protein